MSTSRRRLFGRQRNSQNKPQSGVRALRRRLFFAEQLEKRTLMAADANPFFNNNDPNDVNGDGYIAPNDVLSIVNSLNTYGTQSTNSLLASMNNHSSNANATPAAANATATSSTSVPMLDVNNDGYLTPLDALRVINELNDPAASPQNMNIRLETDTLTGTVIPNGTTIPVGTQYLVKAFVQDTRATPTGVFAAYMGLNYPTTTASVDLRENQVITINGNPTGGTFTLTFNGQTTAPITYDPSDVNTGLVDPSPSQIQTALQSLSSIGAGNVLVTRADNTTSTWTVKFGGKFANTTPPAITGNASSLTGGSGVSIGVAIDPTNPADTPSQAAAEIQRNQIATFVSPYLNGQSADGSTPGIVAEVGAFAGTNPTGALEKQLFVVEMTATAAGTIALTTTPATQSPGHDDLFYGTDTAIDTSTINFGTTSLIVTQTVSAVADTATAVENVPNNSINVLANDSITDAASGGKLQIISAVTTSTKGGTVTVDRNGTPTNFADDVIRYTPATNFSGTDTFTYVAGDGLGNTSTATVTVTVGPVNQQPVITLSTSSLTTAEDTAIVFSQANGNLATFSDPDSNGNNETVTVSVAHGTLTLASLGGLPVTGNGTSSLSVTAPLASINTALAATTLTYQPTQDYNGSDSLTVNLNDLGNTGVPGALSANKVVPITISAVNDAPVNTVPASQSVINTNTLTFSTANGNAISVNDVDAGSASIKVTVTVTNGTLTAGSSTGVTGNGTTSLTINGPLATANAALAGLVYTPTSSFSGTDTLTIVSNDNGNTGSGGAKTTTSTVSISVAPPVFPFASNESFTVDEDSGASTFDVLSKDFAHAGSNATLLSFTQPSSGGTVTLVDNGTPADLTDDKLSFTPAADFNGTATFTYTINDTNGTGQNSTGTVTVIVNPVNDPPVANADTLSATEDTPFTFQTSQLTANDSPGPANESSQTLTVTQVATVSAGGSVTLNNNGTITYTPALNFNGPFTFTYTVTDNGTSRGVADPLTAVGTVTINVAAVNDAPVANADTASTPENVALTIADSVLLGNDTPGGGSDEANQTLTITGVTLGNNGVSVAHVGTNVIFTPTTNFFGTATFTYTVTDNGSPAASSVGTVTVTVTPVNQPPVVQAETVTAIKNVSTTYTAATLLAGDTPGPANESSQTLSITAISATSAQGGTITLNSTTGAVTYTPPANFTGADSFTYTVTDNGTSGSPATADPQSTTATANITVLDFIPSTISGFVYLDEARNGIKVSGEPGLAGVTVTLAGTDFQNAPVNITVKTASDGSYSFNSLAPGNYTVTATQPGNINPGINTPGAGATVTAGVANQFSFAIPIAGGLNSTDNNFGEGYVKPVFASTFNPLLASANPTTTVIGGTNSNGTGNGLVFSFDNTATSQLGWYLKLNGWDAFTPVSLVLSADHNSAVLTVLNGSNQQVSTTVTAASGHLKFKDDGSGHSVVDVIGLPTDFNFASNSVVPSVMEDSDATEQATLVAAAAVAGSHTDDQYSQAADAVFAQSGWVSA